MNTEFDYSLVPENYIHCFKADCRNGENCLHRLVALHAPKEVVVRLGRLKFHLSREALTKSFTPSPLL
ncbi:hypothetical protein JN06_00196 [Bacteroides zoogleoformans]|uniref:DUF6078 family protein n=1 Tax=Bacteroides zoogleoformans TaxID=28119 RepID=UPI0011AC3C0E|nr:DUF6078 family protein [Bacteroides zoogleoformans]TWJ18608.1 hypothetical protein JN06_00196 [Bacteroides zoogleoformans]